MDLCTYYYTTKSMLSKTKLLVLVSKNVFVLKNEHILAGEVSTERLGAKRSYCTDDKVKDAGSISGERKDELFLNRLACISGKGPIKTIFPCESRFPCLSIAALSVG